MSAEREQEERQEQQAGREVGEVRDVRNVEAKTPERVVYHLQVSYCGKARCRKCREGIGHGPYWYFYRTHNGHTRRHYVGKQLPPDVQPLVSTPWIAYPVAPIASTTSSDSSPVEVSLSAQVQEQQRSPGRTHQGPLIGRDREWAMLHDLLLHVEKYMAQDAMSMQTIRATQEILPLDTQRDPQCALLTGDTGIGKTRLAEELGLAAQRRGWLVLWSRVYSQESNVPYRTWIELLRRAVQHDVFSLDSSAQPAHATLLSRLSPLVALLPDLSEYIAVARPDKQAMATFTSSGGEQERLRIQEAVHTLFTTLCEQQPVLIVLDDLQWADASSCGLLSYLARHIYGYPILLVGTYRENEQNQHLLQDLTAHMKREHTVLTQHIDPLSNEEIGLLVSHVTHPEPLAESIIQHIQMQASGNPFFAEELARSGPLPTLPTSITSTLDTRIGKLSASCQQMLRNAAVLGNTFELPVILAVEGTSEDDDTLFDLLEEATSARVLSEESETFGGSRTQAHTQARPQSRPQTRITYSFWHPLLANHLYQHTSAARRTRIHQRAALILQRMYNGREDEVAATITHHLIESGAEQEEIVYYAILAGNRAYAVSAFTEAMQHYRAAAERVEHATSLQKQAQLAYLLERLAECSMILGLWAEARTLFERLLAVRGILFSMYREQGTGMQAINRVSTDAAHSTVDTRFIASDAAHLYEAQVQALIWGEISRTWRYQGNSAETRLCCERGEEELREHGITTGLAQAKLRYQDGGLLLLEGRFTEALEASLEALILFEQQARTGTDERARPPMLHVYSPDIPHDNTYMTRIQRTLFGDPVDIGRVHMQLGLITTSQGQLSTALVHLNTALALFERYDQARETAHAQCNIGYLHLTRGDFGEAQQALQRSLTLAARIEDGPLSSVVYSNLAKLATRSEKYDDAELWYRRALSIARQNKDRDYENRWNVDVAAVFLQQGKLANARACLVTAFRVGLKARNNLWLGNALAAMGNYRIVQARAEHQQQSRRGHFLAHAAQNARHVLALEGIETQTRIRSQFILAQVSLLSGKTARARQELQAVVDDAHRHELASLEAAARKELASLR